MGLFETANSLAIKAAVQQPEYVALTTEAATLSSAVPPNAAAGEAVTAALYSEVIVGARRNPAKRTVVLTLVAFNNLTTGFPPTIGGAAIVIGGGPWASATLALAALAAGITGGGAGVTATSDATTVTITGNTAADFSFDAMTAATAATTFSLAGDASAGIFSVWVLPTSSLSLPWALAGTDFTAQSISSSASPTKRLLSSGRPVPTNGCDRIYVQASTLTIVTNDAGAPAGALTTALVPTGRAWIGPSYATTEG